MKRKFKLLAAALAAITAMSCASATAFADLSSDLAAISNQLSDNTNLSKLPIYNLSSNVPIKLNEYTDFSCDMVDCCLVGEEIYHISTMLSFQEKYDEWDKLMQDMRSYTNKKIPINSYEKLRKLKPFGILINVDGKCPGLLYRINDDILICAYYDIKYDNSGNIISLTNDKSMVNYCICNKLSASVLYKNCWYTSATDKDFTVYIGKNGLPVTKNSTIDGVRYIFNKYGKCEGKYTGWAKNSKGKVYYKDGVKVTKNTTIGGVRYKFSSDGYCKGKFTGFTKSSQGRKYWSKGILTKDEWVQDPKGNYYYAGNDGYLYTGWHRFGGGPWHFFNEKGIDTVGKVNINGRDYYFYENGGWGGNGDLKESFREDIEEAIPADIYGGSQCERGMWIIYSLDTKKAKKIVDELYPGYIEIMYRKCRFTEAQLMYTIEELEQNPFHYYIDMYIDYEKNMVILSVEKKTEGINEWIASLRYKECIYYTYNPVENDSN